jgi:hypothetical protein
VLLVAGGVVGAVAVDGAAGLVAGAAAVEELDGVLPVPLGLLLLPQPPIAKPMQATAIPSVVRFMRFLLT